MDADTPISQLPGIGKYYFYKLKGLEIKTVEDLIYHLPFRYDDFAKIEKIQSVTPGQKLSIVGIVWQITNIRARSGKFITRATVADESGTIEVIWFNQPFLTKNIKAGMQISLAGKADLQGSRVILVSPTYEILRRRLGTPGVESNIHPGGALVHTARLVPVYPETEGITSRWLRAKIASVLPEYLRSQKDFIPYEILEKQKFIKLDKALHDIHFPNNFDEVEKATKRLSFDELFLIQLTTILRKQDWQKKRKAPAMKLDKEKISQFVESLPFKLTAAQKKAARQILFDLKKTTPQNRLLEGDVGSGKTVVAAIAAYVAYLNGFDTLLAAPTEILAFQHHQTLTEILSSWAVKIGIWTGSKKSAGNITCGTHALLSTFKQQRPIGLVIVDEQHRFGVAQRAKLFLRHNLRLTPHLLTMTATPIPRTLALTLYGDLDLSILDEMPQGRQKIATFVVPNLKRNNAYKFIEKQVFEGRQAFIITPFIEPSETMITVKAAKVEFGKLKDKFSKNISLGLLHGRLKSKEKEEIISKFRKNKIHILVTTPVVEVGIDIPNATVMMIESAERFGLAQLHQLRGRVGRGKHKSYCLLFTDSRSPGSYKRLKSMEKIYVGAELAEIDLKMRGPGEIFGLKQSGFINLKIANLSDHQMIARAQEEAKRIIEIDPILKSFPILKQKISKLSSAFAQPN